MKSFYLNAVALSNWLLTVMDHRTCQCKKRNVNPLKKKFSRLLKKNSHSETEKLRNEIDLVKHELEKAYDVIDEMEFELESVSTVVSNYFNIV